MTDLHLIRGQVLPRLRELIISWELGLALLCGVALTIRMPHLPAATLQTSQVVSIAITFAALATGACFSSIVLALGLPGTERIRRWSGMEGTVPGKSALSDLIFVLVWAALVQVTLILVCVLELAFGGNLPLAPPGMLPTHWFGLGAGIVVFFYAVFELVIVVQTLSQMGVMIIAEELSEKKKIDSS